MCDLRSWYLNIFHNFLLMWLLGVILFELVLCSTHDVHRIVVKTHHRKNRERDNYKYHSDHRFVRKPKVQQPNEDEWPSETIQTAHHYYNYRPNHKNESNNGNKRGKSRNYTTVKSPPLFNNIVDIVEFTTATYSGKIPTPVIENTFKSYYHSPSNNSLDLTTPIGLKRQNANFSGKVRQLREKETSTSKNMFKGYEVYEEIIGDISPPHNLLVNNVKNLPVVTTTFSIITQKDEENHIKENVSDYAEDNTKTYGKRTKSGRNRGSVKFE